MNARTAAPAKQLIQTAANEFRRRLSTTSRSLPVKVIDNVMREYSSDLQRGGFSKAWVQEAMRSAMRWYSRACRRELDGGDPINRPESV